MADGNPLECPFCVFVTSTDYQMMLHIETMHSEDGMSPLALQGDASIPAPDLIDDENSKNYARCPLEGCGEAVLLTELSSHIEMHQEEQNTEDSNHLTENLKLGPEFNPISRAIIPSGLRGAQQENRFAPEPNSSRSCDPLSNAEAIWKSLLKMPERSSKSGSLSSSKGRWRRLGKSELGPYAHEEKMPAWLSKLLKEEDGVVKTTKVLKDGQICKVEICPNMMTGVLPVLEQLLDQDGLIEYAYLCHPVVRHVSKIRREGGFCGYRNIQMLSSYIVGTKSQGYDILGGRIPSIFEIQGYIEGAWDIGINSQGRIETGGIRGTRKYIGTPDAQAMFCSLGIACDAQGLKPRAITKAASELLFRTVEDYFYISCKSNNTKVRTTSLPPLYFQHPGHSMTIVGFEKKKDGSRNVLVFDPMFHDGAGVVKLIGQKFKHHSPENLLKAYRRGVKYLKKYNEFEILKLTPPP